MASIEDQFGDLDNFEINGETLNADEVDIIATVVPTGDESTPFRVEVEIKPKDPDTDFGKVAEITFVPPPDVVLPDVVLPPLPPPVVSPIIGG